jgi:peroxiredoxin
MNKINITLILGLNCLTIFAQKSFYYNISTTLPSNEKVTKLYIAYEMAGIKFKDSLDFNKKKLTLKKTLTQPVAASIYTNSNKIEPLSVMLANNILSVVISDNSISIGKSKLQDDFLYLTANDRIRPGYFPLYGELSAKNDTAGLNKLGVIFDSLKNDDIKKSLDYFKSNKTSLLSLYSFNRFTTFFADYSKVEKDFALLPTWAKSSPDGKSIAAKIEGAKSAQINTQAKKFVQQSSTGQKISLEAFEGKYVLLDFWASWCAPCRKEHPNLIKTYEQFKNKNFEIISVSLDSENDNWINAIVKDKLTWTQISDLKGQQNDIAVQYGVQSVPANFLINPKGVIIEKNLTGEELYMKLKTLLDR